MKDQPISDEDIAYARDTVENLSNDTWYEMTAGELNEEIQRLRGTAPIASGVGTAQEIDAAVRKAMGPPRFMGIEGATMEDAWSDADAPAKPETYRPDGAHRCLSMRGAEQCRKYLDHVGEHFFDGVAWSMP